MPSATLPLPIIWQALYETLASQSQDEPLSITGFFVVRREAKRLMLVFRIRSVFGTTDWTYFRIFIEGSFLSGTVAFGRDDTLIEVAFLANIIRLVGCRGLDYIDLDPLIRCFIECIEKRKVDDGANQALSDHPVDNSAN